MWWLVIESWYGYLLVIVLFRCIRLVLMETGKASAQSMEWVTDQDPAPQSEGSKRIFFVIKFNGISILRARSISMALGIVQLNLPNEPLIPF